MTKQSIVPQRRTALNPIKTGLFALALASGLTASAQTTVTSTNFNVGATVPDYDPSGLASAKVVSTPIAQVTGLKVSVKLSGTFNGDVYCYLAHNGTNAILLNRPTSSPGYTDEGFDLTFDDAATNGDVHVYRAKLGEPIGGPLTNSWAPDARRSNPATVLTADARTGFLSSFNGMNPNGEWVLYVADMKAGDVYTLNNWGLEITGYTRATIVSAPVQALTPNITGSAMDNGVFHLRFGGIPGFTYHIERTGSLKPAVWTDIGSVVAPEDGQVEFDDNAPPSGSAYYRTVVPLP